MPLTDKSTTDMVEYANVDYATGDLDPFALDAPSHRRWLAGYGLVEEAVLGARQLKGLTGFNSYMNRSNTAKPRKFSCSIAADIGSW